MASLRESHMTQSDFFSWNMEQDPILRSTIVAVIVLDTKPDWDRFVVMMDRATRVVPNFRHNLVPGRFGMVPPHWVVDPDFDLSWHLRHLSLPEPANMETVLDFARRLGMESFDKDRPLWNFTLLDGLDDGRTALVLKVHHSLTDGIGGMQIAGEIVDFERGGTDRGPLPDVPRSPHVSAVADTVAWEWTTGLDLARSGAGVALPALRRTLFHPLSSARSAAGTAAAVARFVRPIPNPLSPVMRKRSLGRRFAVLDLPVEALHQAARNARSTLNDAFLASILLGLQKYHEVHGATVEQLRVTVPVSLRTETDAMGGNRITLVRLALPANVPDPTELMHQVDKIIEVLRRDPAIPLTNEIAGALNLLPPGYLAMMLKHVDFLASDVPGSPIPLFLAGAEVERYYAFGPTLGTALNVTLMSHTGTCCVGINVDTASVPDLPIMIDCLAEGFRTVLSLCSTDPSIDTTVVTPGHASGS
ncbi:MAG: wax ester/triacylglycerol synthase domain-containing protein [Rhodococcus sp. (in: high G+C Gram-positive bacteria)]|uniref:wax ester/triacylglycerol synthase domain-containing protein n=1 Tax=Rhodococcus sp. TaxID=1831 RepID=UPI003BB220AC